MKRLLKWFLMLNKRLYKKPSFIAILLIIPIAIFSLGIVASLESGFLRIVLAETDCDDVISSEIIQKLNGNDSLLQFIVVDDPAEATQMVRNGEADAAWIFAEGMKESIDQFVQYGESENPIVTVIEREQTVFSRVAREKLTFTLQHYATKAYYVSYARASSEVLNALTDEQLIEYFENTSYSSDLFVYDTAGEISETMPEADYISAPIRGFLAVVAMLSGLAAVLFFMQDRESGTFSWVPENKRIYVAFACILIAVLNVGAVVLIALAITGLSVSIAADIVYMIFFAICAACFSLLLLELFKSIRMFASVIPMLITLMMVICPVIYDYRNIRPIQHLFPPTFFINAAYEEHYLIYMIVYSLICSALIFVLRRFKRIK